MATVPLYTLNDGSSLRVIKASELVSIPVWKGNRIIDSAHVTSIRETVGANVRILDFGYRLVTYDVLDAGGRRVRVTELVDGQHRHAVLCEHFRAPYFGEDFNVVVTVKQVESELEIIEYFNMLNHVKSITWTDMNLVANAYIIALERAFNKPKMLYIRPKSTTRPYLCVDKVREELKKYSGLSGSRAAIDEFVRKVVAWNTERVLNAELEAALGGRHAEFLTKAAGVGFMLAVDPRLPWIRACV
jgi:hypothetical protein